MEKSSEEDELVVALFLPMTCGHPYMHATTFISKIIMMEMMCDESIHMSLLIPS